MLSYTGLNNEVSVKSQHVFSNTGLNNEVSVKSVM